MDEQIKEKIRQASRERIETAIRQTMSNEVYNKIPKEKLKDLDILAIEILSEKTPKKVKEVNKELIILWIKQFAKKNK